MKRTVLAGVALATAYGVAGTAVAEPSRGEVMTAACAQCHGTAGGNVSGFESLTGDSAAEMYDELLEQKNETSNGIMNLQARGYTDAQLLLISEYLATVSNSDNGGGNSGGDNAGDNGGDTDSHGDHTRKHDKRGKKRDH